MITSSVAEWLNTKTGVASHKVMRRGDDGMFKSLSIVKILESFKLAGYGQSR